MILFCIVDVVFSGFAHGSFVVWPDQPRTFVFVYCRHHAKVTAVFARFPPDSATLTGPIRRKRARARAHRWRKEQLRVRAAEAREEQLAKEMRDKLRAEVAIKVKALERQEALLQQR